MKFVSRAGDKLEFALKQFGIDVRGSICADLGCSTGGFTDCLLQRGAAQVYAIDTGYGVLDWKLRQDPRVVVMERQNALHVQLPQHMDFIGVDVGWTKQGLILPHALSLLKPEGNLVSLLKPHYEMGKAHLTELESQEVAQQVVVQLKGRGINIVEMILSPIFGEKAKNREYLLLIRGR